MKKRMVAWKINGWNKLLNNRFTQAFDENLLFQNKQYNVIPKQYNMDKRLISITDRYENREEIYSYITLNHTMQNENEFC